jgi:hypothetical protein
VAATDAEKMVWPCTVMGVEVGGEVLRPEVGIKDNRVILIDCGGRLEN